MSDELWDFELKMCPFHNCSTCGCYDTLEIPDKEWQKRPYEDALLKRAEQGERDAQIWRHNAENWYARAEKAEAMTVRFMDLCVDMAGSGYYNPDFIDRHNVIYREWKEGQK